MKTCSKCKIEKSLSDFHNVKNGKFGKHHYCKDCMSAHKKQTYNYNNAFNRRLRKSYNLTLDELKSMHHSQNKKCKICGDVYEDVSKHGGLYIDHCHSSGKVRGLLCAKCNQLLGACRDDVAILQSAIDYLNSQK
jgi:protein-arginine kinase activator protein McsA